MRNGHKEFITTGRAAKLLGVAPRTVSKLVDSGKIEGCYAVPGGTDRRIPYNGLVRYLRSTGAHVLADRCVRANGVLILGAMELRETLMSLGQSVIGVHNPFYFGMELAKQIPSAVVIDATECGITAAVMIANHCSVTEKMPNIWVILTEDCSLESAKEMFVSTIHVSPPQYIAQLLARQIRLDIYEY